MRHLFVILLTTLLWVNPAMGLGECNDGIDNDGDGWVDYHPDVQCDQLSPPQGDPGCWHPVWDRTEKLDCEDGIDNDGDGFIDLDDRGCFASYDGTEKGSCADGIDNDCDGKIDRGSNCSNAGAGCTLLPGWHPTSTRDDSCPVLSQPYSERRSERTICGDARDNDRDGNAAYAMDFDGSWNNLTDDQRNLDIGTCWQQTGMTYAEAQDVLPDCSYRVRDKADPYCACWAFKDPDCTVASIQSEVSNGPHCGLGAELALILPLLMWLRRRVQA